MGERRDGCKGADGGGGPCSGFDLAIAGGGTAAFAAALRASELGARTLIVNEGTLGGTCVNVGCVPSKTLIRAAENAHWSGLSRFRGIKPEGSRVDVAELVREKDELVEDLRRVKYSAVLARLGGAELVEGRAVLDGAHRIRVGETFFEADKILLATGSRPSLPPIPGLREAGVWDSTQALAVRALPAELLVLGGGYVALELAQMFARLGSRVAIVQRSPQILRGEDPDVVRALVEALESEGIELRTGQQVERVEREGETFRVTVRANDVGHELVAGAVLAALGRQPNSEGLGPVILDARGFVQVAEDLQTSVPGVYAAGDVIGDPVYVYAAAYEGRLAAQNALGSGPEVRDYTALPWVIFTDPQVAGVGLNEREARAAGLEVDVVSLPLAKVPRALAARDTRGVVKLLRAHGEDRLVGARFVAPEGGEQIMEPALMIRFGLPISRVAAHFHPYLTQSEAVKLALLAFDKDIESLSCCAS
ncbi:MAG: mercury(II) reductase [Myxococcota bacterium]